MIHWSLAEVKERIDTRKGIQKVKVELQEGPIAIAIHYTDVLPEVGEGDIVLLNTTAMDLSLGTGGVHFIYSIVKGNTDGKRTSNPPHRGHMMKLRYTPQQRAIFAAEEADSPHHHIFTQIRTLENMPVLIGELHSMLPIIMCWFNHISSIPKIVYIMSDGGALPLALSDHVANLNELGWLTGTITYGQAYGGDLETMNKYTALIAARHILDADIAIVIMGPGIAGTETTLGHTGTEVGEVVNAVSTLEGIPIMIPRISFADKRQRHHGLSHHILSSLCTIALKPANLPLPKEILESEKQLLNEQMTQSGCEMKHRVLWIPSIEISEIKKSLIPYPQEITTMGRGIDADPVFFQAVCSAAQFAWNVYSDALRS